MKKLLFILMIVLLMPTNCLAEDYWVYIRMEDRPGVTKEEDAGRSKRGDVVHIQKAVAGQQPTAREQQEYAIITVPDLTEKELSDLQEKFKDKDYVKADPLEPDKFAANRLQKVDVNALNLQKGFDETPLDKIDFKNNVSKKNKIDLTRYEAQRLIYAGFIRPAMQIDNIIVRQAHAAQDISKICATGSNCTDEDYNSLATWEDTEDGDLDGENRQETAECYDDDGDLTANVTVAGSTTSSSDYMEITCPVGERHDGTHSGGGCTLNASGNVNISLQNDYSRLSWMIIKGQTGTGFLHQAVEYSGAENSTINNLVIYDPAGGCTGAWITAPITIHTIMCVTPGTVGFYSNSVSGGQALFDSTCLSTGDYCVDGTGFTCENLALFDSAIEDSSGCGSETNVATSDASGTTGVINLTASDQFVSVTATSEDLHLKTGANLISAGATPTPGAKNDIDNTSRPQDTYDIGADEFEAAAPPTFKRKTLIF